MANSELCGSVTSDFRNDAFQKLKHMCSVLQMEDHNYLSTFIFFITKISYSIFENVHIGLVCGLVIINLFHWISVFP